MLFRSEARLKEQAPKVLGRIVTPEEFMKSPELQEEFQSKMLDKLQNQFGFTPEEILATHRGGWGDVTKDEKTIRKMLDRKLKERKDYVTEGMSIFNEDLLGTLQSPLI